MEENLGGLLLISTGIEPLYDLNNVSDNKKEMKIIVYGSEGDQAVPWDYANDQIKKLEKAFTNVSVFIHPTNPHVPIKPSVWDSFRKLLIKEMYKSTFKFIYNEDQFERYILEPLSTHKTTLLFIHGYGDYQKDWLQRFIREDVPVSKHTKVIFVQGDVAYTSSWTPDKVPAWA